MTFLLAYLYVDYLIFLPKKSQSNWHT